VKEQPENQRLRHRLQAVPLGVVVDEVLEFGCLTGYEGDKPHTALSNTGIGQRMILAYFAIPDSLGRQVKQIKCRVTKKDVRIEQARAHSMAGCVFERKPRPAYISDLTYPGLIGRDYIGFFRDIKTLVLPAFILDHATWLPSGFCGTLSQGPMKARQVSFCPRDLRNKKPVAL
jgi:hypothetical protein